MPSRSYSIDAMENTPQTVWNKLNNQGRLLTTVKEKSHGLSHEVFSGAPCGWSDARGATHTLYCGEGHLRGTRPARLLKTVLWVGVDEVPTADGEDYLIVWERWHVRAR